MTAPRKRGHRAGRSLKHPASFSPMSAPDVRRNPQFREEDYPEQTVTVPAALAGTRLDKVLRELMPDQSRAYLRDLVEFGFVKVGARVENKARYLCKEGDVVRLRLVPRRVETGPPPPTFRVLHHDDSILVIAKPAGLPAHRNERELRGTVADYAQRDFGLLPTIQGAARPGIVHRLDKDTSGVMVLARTDDAAHELKRQFAARTVRKEYRAIVYGELPLDSYWIDKAIDRDPHRPSRMSVVDEGGRESETFVEVVKRARGFTHVRCAPKTGRTHQIRVHMASIGHSIVGDRVYRRMRGPLELPAGAPPVARQLLHAHRLEFDHPATGERIAFEADLPDDFRAFVEWMGAE